MTLLTLSGCATRTRVALPSDQYLQDCVAPAPTGRTNAAHAAYTLALKDTLALCNADKAALRQWVQSVKK